MSTTSWEVSVDTSKLAATLEKQIEKARTALPRMASSMLVEAKMKAPKKSGDLRASGRVKNSLDESEVSFGGNAKTKPYAYVQERGYAHKGRPFRHYTTPGTGAHYLENAKDVTLRKGIGAFTS